MSYPTYEILIISPATGDILKVLSPSNAVEIKYSRVINDVGTFTIVFRGRALVDEVVPLFGTDTIVEIYRDSQTQSYTDLTKEGTYFTRLRKQYIDDEGIDSFIVGGFCTNHLLQRRTIDPSDDSVQPNGGYATKAGAADTVLRDYIREQAADLASTERQTLGLTVPAVAGTFPTVGKRIRFKNLLAICQEISAAVNVDFYIERTTGLNFECYIGTQGTDRTYKTNKGLNPFTIFNPLRGNLRRPAYEIDEKKEVNFLYVQGPGEGARRFVLEVPGSDRMAASLFNRCERAIDARNTKVGGSAAMLSEGQEKLVTDGVQIDFNINLIPQIGGTKYREDIFLGDKVTVVWRDIIANIRITKIEFTLTQNSEEILIEVSKDEYTS